MVRRYNKGIFFCQEAIHELYIQIDKFEADIETISASLRKKKSDKDVSYLQHFGTIKKLENNRSYQLEGEEYFETLSISL